MSKRGRRIAVCVAFLTGGLVSGACRSATQAELDVSTTAQCSELGSVALVVSGDPESAESRVQQGFYAAQTTDCDVNRWIGSLVVTPGEDRAAVIVIAPPAGTPISQCEPPKYAGCIVARRAFSFISHVGLKIPISLDVECRDVPCDAFSTCRKGACYSSETTCDDTGTCLGAGELPDGGVSPEASIAIDGSPPHDGAAGDGAQDEGGLDAATDAADAADATDSGDSGKIVRVIPAGIICVPTDQLNCQMVACAAQQACCGTAPTFVCGMGSAPACMGTAERYCCKPQDCGGPIAVPGQPGLVGSVCLNHVAGDPVPGTCGQ